MEQDGAFRLIECLEAKAQCALHAIHCDHGQLPIVENREVSRVEKVLIHWLLPVS